jgi:hypothetical protein
MIEDVIKCTGDDNLKITNHKRSLIIDHLIIPSPIDLSHHSYSNHNRYFLAISSPFYSLFKQLSLRHAGAFVSACQEPSCCGFATAGAEIGRPAYIVGHALERPVSLHLFDVLQPLDRPFDGVEVREGPAQPAVRDEELAAAAGLFLDHVLRLTLGSDEEHVTTASSDVGDVAEGRPRHGDRLLQVDDVDAVAGAKDVRLHLRVPTLRLMAEVNSGLEELPHGDSTRGSHLLLLILFHDCDRSCSSLPRVRLFRHATVTAKGLPSS